MHDAASLRGLFASFSPFKALAPKRQQAVLEAIEALVRDKFDNRVERPYVTSLYLARKQPR